MSQSTQVIDVFQAAYTDLYFAPPLELDYDEPNAVVDADAMEFVVMGNPVRSIEMPVIVTPARREQAPPLVETADVAPQRTAA